jgi:histidinol-phosphate/aromatic aminotransferase/cobyric acid decarboxylase-like protein
MTEYRQLVPEHVRTLGGYTPGKSRRQAQQESQVTCIKMASNENPFAPSPKAVAAMKSVLAERITEMGYRVVPTWTNFLYP